MKILLILLLFTADPYVDREFGEMPNSGFGEEKEWYMEQAPEQTQNWQPGDGEPPWAGEPGGPTSPTSVPLDDGWYIAMLFALCMFLAWLHMTKGKTNKFNKNY